MFLMRGEKKISHFLPEKYTLFYVKYKMKKPHPFAVVTGFLSLLSCSENTHPACDACF